MLLLGSYTRFSCPLIKWNLQREKNNKSPLHPLYPIFLHPTGWTNRAINELHVSNLFDNNFSLNILYILYAAVLDAMFFFQLCLFWPPCGASVMLSGRLRSMPCTEFFSPPRKRPPSLTTDSGSLLDLSLLSSLRYNLFFYWTKCLKNQPIDVIKMRDYPSLFRGKKRFSFPLLPSTP